VTATDTLAGAASAERLALFLDFDGTLVDIADRPEAVIVDPKLPEILRSVRGRCGGALAIVTGRSVAAIEGFLPGLDLDICGLHGMERRLGGVLHHLAVEDPAALRAAVAQLTARLAGIPNVLIEDKGESVALHWRLNPDAEWAVRQAAGEAMAALGSGFRLQNGKAVVEIVPAISGKGSAVEALMRDAPYRGRVPLFAGDDVTDENGFAAVRPRGGVTLKVGQGDTIAERRIASPTLLRQWLEAFAAGKASADELGPA
jgi:trehalose 6-phosphate phosphatase